ncbi:zinc finger, CCHC-type containing protein [Tanacetum coccineum]|uniref:Zinc finger, CCHC-type containing protein n=1 Tax=Tanacetum coccineum TaxID=301880 RepID=A0ABQ5F0Q3_9ASTR
MTKCSNKDLIQPFDKPERYEDQSEEEVTETMMEPNMEEYMTMTREGYGSGIARHANEHIEKVLEIVDLFHIPNITQDQVMLRDFLMSLTGAVGRWLRNEPAGSITTWETLKEKFLNIQEVISFYKGLDVPTRQIHYFKGAISSMKATDAMKAIQDIVDHSKKWHNGTSTRCKSTKTSDRLAAFQAQLITLEGKSRKRTKKCMMLKNSNLINEIRASTDAAIRNLGASIKALEIQTGQMSKLLQEKGSRNLPSSTEMNPRDHVKSILTTVETATIPFPCHLYDDCCDEEEGSYGLKDLDAYLIRTTLLDDALPPKEKYPGNFTLPCYINNFCFNNALADLGASVSFIPFLTYTNLGLGKLAPTKLIIELADRTMKRPKGIAKNVLVGIDKFVFPIDFMVLDMPEDIKTPLILGRRFLSTAYAKIDVFKRKITLRVGNDKVVFKSEKPTSNIIKRVYALCLRERMELDLEARQIGEALILNRSLDLLYGDYIELNDLNEPLELRRNQVDDLEPAFEEGGVVDEPMMDIVKIRCDVGPT